MALIQLKICPFCGCWPKMGSLGGDKENWAIWCDKCHMACAETGLHGETKEEIIKTWNQRAASLTNKR